MSDWKKNAIPVGGDEIEEPKAVPSWRDRAIDLNAAPQEIQPDSPQAYAQMKPRGELGLLDRFRLGFASGGEERRGLLDKLYPGIKVIDDNTVIMPGQKAPSYIDDPGFSAGDIADFGGDVPSMVLGAGGAAIGTPFGAAGIYAGTGSGAAAGEGIRKKIGRDIIGIPKKQTDAEDALDIATVGTLAPLLEAAGSGVVSPAMKAVGNAGGKALGKAKGLISSAAENIRGILGDVPQGGFSVMGKAVQKAEKAGRMPNLPQLAEVEAAERVLPDLKYKVDPVQKQMYSDKQAMDKVGAIRKSPTTEGDTLSRYEMLQKQELTEKLGQELDNVAPGYIPKEKPEEAGHSLVKTVKDQYESQKKALAPVFDKIDSAPVGAAKSHLASLRMILGKEFKALDEAISYGPGGIKMPPYSPKLGISKGAYGMITDTMETLSDPSLTIKNLRNIREALRREVPPGEKGFEEVTKLRRGILDHLERIVGEVYPDTSVRQSMRQYAQNESKRDMMETMLGGSLENFAKATDAPIAEKALNRVFSDTNNIELTRDVLGEQRFREVVSDFMATKMQEFTDKGVFSPQKFSTYVKKNGAQMREMFRGNERGLQRMQAAVDLMRMIPDAPNVNQSNTAPTSFWLKMITEGPGPAAKGLVRHGVEKRAGKRAAKALEKQAGVARRTGGKNRSTAIGTAQEIRKKGLLNDDEDSNE